MGILIIGIILLVVGVGLIVLGLSEAEESPAFFGTLIATVGFIVVVLFICCHRVEPQPAPIHICSHCASEIQAATNNFCPECGTRIEETECSCDRCVEPTTEACTCDRCLEDEATIECTCDKCQ